MKCLENAWKAHFTTQGLHGSHAWFRSIMFNDLGCKVEEECKNTVDSYHYRKLLQGLGSSLSNGPRNQLIYASSGNPMLYLSVSRTCDVTRSSSPIPRSEIVPDGIRQFHSLGNHYCTQSGEGKGHSCWRLKMTDHDQCIRIKCFGSPFTPDLGPCCVDIARAHYCLFVNIILRC